jgi:hypothetical protein
MSHEEHPFWASYPAIFIAIDNVTSGVKRIERRSAELLSRTYIPEVEVFHLEHVDYMPHFRPLMAIGVDAPKSD